MTSTKEKSIFQPEYSVIIPLYNGRDEILRAVNSVRAQTFPSFEIIVVDDGSADGGSDLVREIGDDRMRVIRQDHAGVAAARNRGIKESRALWIALLDSDDEWMPHFLMTVHGLRKQHPECNVVVTKYLFCEKDGLRREPIMKGIPGGEWTGELTHFFSLAVQSDPILCSSVITVRKTALESVGGFMEGVTIGEDLLTWAYLAARYRIAYSGRVSAMLWLRAPLAGVVTRVPQVPDCVGSKLAELLPQIDLHKQHDFRKFIALWHRMRAVMFLQLGDRKETFREIFNIAKYSLIDIQLYLYLILACVPKGTQRILIRIVSWVKIRKRSKAVIS